MTGFEVEWTTTALNDRFSLPSFHLKTAHTNFIPVSTYFARRAIWNNGEMIA